MLRRCLVSYKVSKNWVKKAGLASSAHFPQAAFVDPALQRGSSFSSKEEKVFALDETDTTALPVGHKGAAFERNYGAKKLIARAHRWADAVRLSDPVPTVLCGVLPALLGTAYGVTKLLVWDGADPIVLMAPFLPLHLVVFFFAGSLLLRGVLSLTRDVLESRGFLRSSTGGLTQTPGDYRSPVVDGRMHSGEACGLLGAHLFLGAIVTLNLSPTAALCIAAGSVPLFAASLAVEVAAPSLVLQRRGSLWLRAAACGVSSLVGFSAVAGPLAPHLYAVVPLYMAATTWSCFFLTLRDLTWLRLLEKEHRESSPQQSHSASPPSSQKPPAGAITFANFAAASAPTVATKGSGWRAIGRAGPSSPYEHELNALLPTLWGDPKSYWSAVLLAPMAISFVSVGMLTSQCLLYYLGLIASVVYLNSLIDHLNLRDAWSCYANFKRNMKFGLLLLLSVMSSNAFWGLATEHNPKADKDSSDAPGTLHNILRMSIVANKRAYEASDFNWADRFLRPAWVQSRVMSLESDGVSGDSNDSGASRDATLPPWMRREYFGQNVGAVCRKLGLLSEETVQSLQQRWYASLDHYNVFTKFVM